MKEEVNNEKMDNGVTVPEEFQQKAHALIKGASKPELNHLSDHISARHEELRKAEMKKNSPKDIEYSTEGMPDSY